jgi:hypothetical protein
MLDVPASNTDGFLSGDTCVSLTQLIQPKWNKQSQHLQKPAFFNSVDSA